MRARLTPFITFLLPLLAIGLLTAPATAQEETGAEQESTAEQTAELSDRTLEKFAEAYLQLVPVRRQMQADLNQAGSQEEQATIRQEANQQMASILRDHGFSPQRYREITQTLNADSAQRAEFQQLLQEFQSEESGG